PIEGDARPPGILDHAAIRDQRFQRGSDIGIPGRLISGQGSCIASQEWQVLCYRSGGIGHGTLPLFLAYAPKTSLWEKRSTRRNGPFCVTLSCDKAVRGPGRGTLPGNKQMNERKPVRAAIAGEAVRAEATQPKPLKSEASMHTDAEVKKTGGRLSREDQRRLGDILQRVYDEVLRQGVPDRFKALLNQFDQEMDTAET